MGWAAFSMHNASAPLALIELGAFYAPIATTEPWRLLSSLVIESSPLTAVVNAIAFAYFGTALIRTTASLTPFSFSILLGAVASGVMAAANDPQALSAGLTPVIATLVCAWFMAQDSLLGQRKALLLAFASLVFSVHIAYTSAWVTAEALCASSAVGLVIGTAFSTRKRFAVTSAAFAIALLLFAGLMNLEKDDDLISALRTSQQVRQTTSRKLQSLDLARSQTWLNAGEFAARVNSEVLLDTQASLEAITALAGKRERPTKWLLREKEALEARSLSLEAMRDVYEAKEHLLAAHEQLSLEPELALSRLDDFWNKSYPVLKNLESKIEDKLNSGSANRTLYSKLDEGFKSDVAALAQSAADIEIVRAETYLKNLRSAVIHGADREPASEASKSDEEVPNDWQTVEQKLDQHRARLAYAAEKFDLPYTRLTQLLTTVTEAQKAVALDSSDNRN